VPARVPGRVRIWDLPTRLFHWAFAGLMTAAWISGQFGGQAWLTWHFRMGYAILALLVFRLLWGYAGDRYARFSTFVPSWRAALGYLRTPQPAAGHNPLGALSVYALLIVAGVASVTGLCASDGDFTEGPWAVLVSDATITLMSRIHRICHWILLALVALHICAIAWHEFARRDPIVRAMVSGDKHCVDTVPAADNAAIRLRAAVLLALSVALVVYGVTL
jgi:cytochrome b